MKAVKYLLAIMVWFVDIPGDYRREMVFAEDAQPISICSLGINPTYYDAKTILLSGVYRRIFHGSLLSGPESCSRVELNVRLSPGYKANKSVKARFSALTQKDPHAPVDVVVRGLFRVAKQGQCFGQICAQYEIEVDEMLSAKQHVGSGKS